MYRKVEYKIENSKIKTYFSFKKFIENISKTIFWKTKSNNISIVNGVSKIKVSQVYLLITLSYNKLNSNSLLHSHIINYGQINVKKKRNV